MKLLVLLSIIYGTIYAKEIKNHDKRGLLGLGLDHSAHIALPELHAAPVAVAHSAPIALSHDVPIAVHHSAPLTLGHSEHLHAAPIAIAHQPAAISLSHHLGWDDHVHLHHAEPIIGVKKIIETPIISKTIVAEPSIIAAPLSFDHLDLSHGIHHHHR